MLLCYVWTPKIAMTIIVMVMEEANINWTEYLLCTPVCLHKCASYSDTGLQSLLSLFKTVSFARTPVLSKHYREDLPSFMAVLILFPELIWLSTWSDGLICPFPNRIALAGGKTVFLDETMIRQFPLIKLSLWHFLFLNLKKVIFTN